MAKSEEEMLNLQSRRILRLTEYHNEDTPTLVLVRSGCTSTR